MITIDGKPMIRFTIRLEIQFKSGIKRMQTFDVNALNRDAAERYILKNHVSADENAQAVTIKLVLVSFSHV